MTKVDAGKKDIEAIIKVISARKPSFEETFKANSHKTITSDGGNVVKHVDESGENSNKVDHDRGIVDTSALIDIPPPMPPIMVKVDTNESPLVNENVESLPVDHELTCPHAALVNFWRPATPADLAYVSPYATPDAGDKYITFEPGQQNYHSSHFLMCVTIFFNS